MSRFIVLLVATGAVLFAATAFAGIVYEHDDGTAEASMGFGYEGDFWWVEGYTAVPSGTDVFAIDILFHSDSGLSSTDSVLLLLYDDPNNDGNPIDADLLTSASATVGSFDTFHRILVTSTTVSGRFFVGALMTQAASDFPAARDTDSSLGFGWVSASTGTLDPTDVAGTTETGVLNANAIGFSGNFMVRAAATPEPGTLALFALGGLALALASRRRRRAR